MSTKICPHKNCVHDGNARPMSDFVRRNKNGGMFVHRICNDCNIRERIVPVERVNCERINIESLIPKPIKRLNNKPVWTVIYRSYWP